MSENNDIVEIEIPTDAAKAKADAKAAKAAAAPVIEDAGGVKGGAAAASGAAAGPTTDEVVEKLKKDLETERAARIAAEKKARDESARASGAETEVGTTQLQLVVGAIDATKRESASLKEKYQAALASQDYAAAADLQELMADTRAKLLNLENGKSAMEDEAKRAKEQPRRIEINDPVEKMANDLTPASGDWVRRHPEYARNPGLTKKMVAAHYAIVAEGNVTEDTPEYFEEIEKKLGMRKAAEPEAEEEALSGAAETKNRRSGPAAAPVSNSGTANGSRPTRATLTKEEAEIAEMNGMTHAEYWESKQALKKQGRLN